VSGHTIRIRPDLTQEEHVEGWRSVLEEAALIRTPCRRTPNTKFRFASRATGMKEVEGCTQRIRWSCCLIGAREIFTVAPPKGHKNYELVDQHLRFAFLSLRVRISSA